ncbi:hypothetical protein PMW_115 [Pseudomonas phage phiPMW]|uniref:DUF6945 domain-containing protein n=1 Tax=Pseudomonas phage phiPMW TaxID=1815582 RepID=A0A1S5R1F2_9CAUD|nr:replication initiation protein [Pseudomonas phage phiPMW]ANA49240.1 hypothetical protein PMW_115 [Pseudomonas phage phiPMW]
MFYKFSQDLCRAHGFISYTTGEEVGFTPAAKIIYTYMLHRFMFHVVKEGREYFESQSTIGEQCGLDTKTVQRQLKVLVTHGVIASEKAAKTGGGHARNKYTRIRTDMTLVYAQNKVVDTTLAPDTIDEQFDMEEWI